MMLTVTSKMKKASVSEAFFLFVFRDQMQEYITLLRNNANYRNLWFGTLVSQLGDWFNLIAAAGLIARLTESGVAVSVLFLARFIPLFL